MHLFITGIGTGVGKTVVSAIVTEALQADYWKPVQAGDLENSDTLKVKALISNAQTVLHSETYRLKHPLSPHAAAARDGFFIDPANFLLPSTDNHLVVEGAGGLMVPLNENFLMIDLISQLNIPVVLVSRHYLGSINHTLLSAFALKDYNIPVAGIVFTGNENTDSESVILKRTGFKMLGRVNEEEQIDQRTVSRYAAAFSKALD